MFSLSKPEHAELAELRDEEQRVARRRRGGHGVGGVHWVACMERMLSCIQKGIACFMGRRRS